MSSRGPPNYHRLEKLGKGSFATVYRAVHVRTNQEAAIKHISQEKLTLKLQENLESEISILKNHSHRNIVRLYDIERNDKHIYIILEYCRGGDLQRFIKNQPGARLSELTAQHFMRHLAAGLKFLNDRNLVHRDIKPQNLLLTENSINAVLKIADFGFARHLEGTSMAETLCGSPLYMAPEILSQNQYNAKADLWSVGAVLFEMVAGRPPFAAQNQVELLKVIKRPLQIPSDVELSRPCVSLLQRLLKREPLERISFEDFFLDPFVDMKSSSDAMMYLEEDPLTGQSLDTPSKHADGQHGDENNENSRGLFSSSTVISRGQDQYEENVGAEQVSAKATIVGHLDMKSPMDSQSPLRDRPRNLYEHDVNPAATVTTSTTMTAATSNRSSMGAPSYQVRPNPRVNPFKPLAASPPGAVALSGHGSRSISSNSASSAKRSASGTGAAVNPSSAMIGSSGGGEGSLESDGFVIIDAEPQSSSTRSTSCQTQAGGSVQQQQQIIKPTGTHGQNSSSSSSSQLTKSSTDSLEGALRVLSYVETSTRRAILIASLGDAKAIAGLSLRRGGLKPSVLQQAQYSVVNTLLGDSDQQQSTGSGSSLLSDYSGDTKAFALLLDALVLYLKALSVVGTAIKALRQVIDVIQSHTNSWSQSQGGSVSGSSGGGGLMRGGAGGGGGWRSGSLDEKKDSTIFGSGSLHTRIAFLREWLESHFGVILERAQECRTHIDTQAEGGGGTGNQPVIVPSSAEELLYKHALSLAKEGAVKELLGQTARGVDLYAQAKLMMEALLAEPLLPVEDQRTLQGYVEEFRIREEELARQYQQQREQQENQRSRSTSSPLSSTP